jgi:hypothetical protein
MRSWRTSLSQAREWFRRGRRGLPGSRRLTLAAVAGLVLVGTVVGVAAAGVSAVPGRRSAAESGSRSAVAPGRKSGTGSAAGHVARNRGRVAGAARPMTSCKSVAHIGDSTSVDLVSPADLPDPATRLPARYADVGVRHLRLDASGGRSIVETLPDQVNGYNVARAWRAQGYRGCWVIALGTNDSANIAAGSTVEMMSRIDEMMSVAHGDPVMWVNPVTRLSSGPWSESGERAFGDALVSALHKYSNLRILNWAAVAKPSWFLPDEIHYNPVGCAMRARVIADGLARAFPLGGASKAKIVR